LLIIIIIERVDRLYYKRRKEERKINNIKGYKKVERNGKLGVEIVNGE